MRETSIVVSGKTADEAIQNALAQIGLDRDDVSVEIVERAKSGFLGLGSTAAQVKVTYMTDEPEPVTEVVVKETIVETVVLEETVKVPVVQAVSGSQAERALKFLTGLFEKMGIAATPELIREEADTLYIELVGNSMGAVIGRRGETLDAIQHLTNYSINRGLESRTRVFLDAESYRKKREEALVRLAQKVAEKVVRYRKNMGLEPMNAYERHVIHTALQEMENITTYSSGSEPNRRVFIAYERSERAERAVQPSAPSAPPAEAASSEKPSYKEWS